MSVVKNWSVRVSGITLYRDDADPSLFYIPPVSRWTPLAENIGNQLTILHGELRLEPTHTERQQLAAALPDASFAAIDSATYPTAIEVGPSVRPPHSCIVRVMPTLPYPWISIDATLLPQAQDYNVTLNALRTAYNSGQILKSPLVAQADLLHVAVWAKVKLEWRKLAVEVKKALIATSSDTESLSITIAHEAVRKVVAQEARQLIETRPSGSPIPKSVVAYTESQLIAHLFVTGISIDRFDDGINVIGCRLREERELHDLEEKILRQSRLELTDIMLM